MYNKESSQNNKSFAWVGIKKQVTEFISGERHTIRLIGFFTNLLLSTSSGPSVLCGYPAIFFWLTLPLLLQADNLFYIIMKKEAINQKPPYILSNKCTNLPILVLILFFPCFNIEGLKFLSISSKCLEYLLSLYTHVYSVFLLTESFPLTFYLNKF